MPVSELVRSWREEEKKRKEENGEGAERGREKVEARQGETKGGRHQSGKALEQEPAPSGDGDPKDAPSIAEEFMGVYHIFAYIGRKYKTVFSRREKALWNFYRLNGFPVAFTIDTCHQHRGSA